jgi:hypothetical protein
MTLVQEKLCDSSLPLTTHQFKDMSRIIADLFGIRFQRIRSNVTTQGRTSSNAYFDLGYVSVNDTLWILCPRSFESKMVFDTREAANARAEDLNKRGVCLLEYSERAEEVSRISVVNTIQSTVDNAWYVHFDDITKRFEVHSFQEVCESNMLRAESASLVLQNKKTHIGDVCLSNMFAVDRTLWCTDMATFILPG